MKFKEFKHTPVQPDTYEASMALNQLMRIGKHAIKLHNMIDDAAEMESWVAKKIDLAGDYVKKVYNYTEGEKAGLYDDGGMTEAAPFGSGMDLVRMAVVRKFISAEEYMNYGKELKAAAEETAEHYDDWPDGEGFGSSDGNFAIRDMMSAAGYEFDEQDRSGSFVVSKMPEKLEKMGIKNARMRDAVTTDSLEARLEAKLKESREEIGDYAKEKKTGKIVRIVDFEDDIYTISYGEDKGENNVEAKDLEFLDQTGVDQEEISKFDEDAGEGHMSKSTLYHTAKYAIALMQMIKPGDDLEGWVQSKLNKAADYLQGVYNYEEYQKLNPYREELDANILQKHAQVVQKNIDEILDKETELDDIDTKPGMMRILAKRVNEVEKEMAKENRKNTDEAHGGQHTTSGRSMTKGEMNKREKIVKGMKKNKAGFKKRYGKDADAVMYATATKQAMKDDAVAHEDGHTDVPSAIRNCETIIEDAMEMKQKLQTMQGELPSWMTQMIAVAASDLNDARDYLLNPTTESGILYRAGVKKYGKAGMKAIQSAAGKGASHQEIGKIKDKHLKDDEDLQEGLKDWVRNTAMAGIIVAGLAGVGSIQDAIDRSVPAVQAMETALEMAQDQGNDELADMIKKDLSAVKVRLESGKDLGFVKGMQDKYSKFIKTEGLSYESKLAMALNQQLK